MKVAVVSMLLSHPSRRVMSALSRDLIRRELSAAATPAAYQHILVERRGTGDRVAVVKLNRPKAMNALCGELMGELACALRALDRDKSVHAMVLTGSDRAFAAGADIKEMADRRFADTFGGRFLEEWTEVSRLSKPIVAAVNGYAVRRRLSKSHVHCSWAAAVNWQ